MRVGNVEWTATGARGLSARWFAVILAAGDAASLCTAFAVSTATSSSLSYLVRQVAPAEPSTGDVLVRVAHVAMLAVPLLLWFAFNGHYTRRLPLLEELKDVCLAVGTVCLADGYLQFVSQHEVSRGWVLLTWLLCFPLIMGCRVGAKRVLYRLGPWRCPTVVVGTRRQLGEIADALTSEHHLGYAPCAFLPIERGCDYVVDRVSRLLASGEARHVAVGLDDARFADALGIARRIEESFDVSVSLVPNLRGLAVGDLRIHRLFGREMVLLSNDRATLRRSRAVGKRLFDIVLATLLLVFAAPLMLVIALLVSLDGGPVLYASRRLGRGGREFDALKFRSMVPDAERVLSELIASDATARAEWRSQFKLRNDPRITWIGGFLRRTSLDELPQIWNVLRGDMSFVGPRPLLPDELARYGEAAYALYSRVTPGLTGMWQVSGRDDLEYYRRVELNNWYIKNWSPWLDLFILARTVGVVTRREGSS